MATLMTRTPLVTGALLLIVLPVFALVLLTIAWRVLPPARFAVAVERQLEAVAARIAGSTARHPWRRGRRRLRVKGRSRQPEAAARIGDRNDRLDTEENDR